MAKENIKYNKSTTYKLQAVGIIDTDNCIISVEGEDKNIMSLAKDFNGTTVSITIQLKEDEELELSEEATIG